MNKRIVIIIFYIFTNSNAFLKIGLSKIVNQNILKKSNSQIPKVSPLSWMLHNYRDEGYLFYGLVKGQSFFWTHETYKTGMLFGKLKGFKSGYISGVVTSVLFFQLLKQDK